MEIYVCLFDYLCDSIVQCSDREFTSFNKKKVQTTKYCSKRTEILVREKVTTLEHNSL